MSTVEQGLQPPTLRDAGADGMHMRKWRLEPVFGDRNLAFPPVTSPNLAYNLAQGGVA